MTLSQIIGVGVFFYGALICLVIGFSSSGILSIVGFCMAAVCAAVFVLGIYACLKGDTDYEHQ